MMKLAAFVLISCFVFAHSVDQTENTDISSDSTKTSGISVTAEDAANNGKEGMLFFKSFVDIVKKTPPSLTDVLDGATKVSLSLGALSAAFAVIFELVDQGKSKELEALEAGFNRADMLFDKTQDQLKYLETLISQENAYSEYEKVQQQVSSTLDKYFQYRINNQSEGRKEEFIQACSDVAKGPGASLYQMRDFFTGSGMSKSLTEVLLDHSNYNFTMLREFFAIITNDLCRAAILYEACVVAKEPKNVALQKDIADESQTIFQDVIGAFQKTLDRLIEVGLEKHLKSDLKQKLKEWSGKQHFEFCWQLKSFLEKKYFWLHWNVIVSNNTDEYEKYVHYKVGTNSFYSHETADRKLIVAWADKRTNQVFNDLLLNIRDGIGFHVCQYPCSGSLEALEHPDRLAGIKNVLSVADTYLIQPLSHNVHVSLGENGFQMRHCGYLLVYMVLDP